VRDKLIPVTPELTVDSPDEAPKQVPSTAGMTTKVVKGSMWTLAGSVAPLAVSFISTPFIIRYLGAESYGVLLLVGLIPAYFSFADFGMGVASTKFASEAYGQGDEKKEAEVVWTAVAIAAVSAMFIAVPIFLFSYPIVKLMNVPEHLLSTASIALKIASGSFFLGILSSVLNSPMLARLRMDLNMLTSAGPKVLLAAVTPFILYFGGGIVEAVSWTFIVSIGMLAVVFFLSGYLLPSLREPRINRASLRPILKFGAATFVATAAMLLLGNLEKFFLVRMESVEALAYYSVAFTFANMATVFSQAMLQSLIPAFSRVNSPERKAEFDHLFDRSMRITLFMAIPISAALIVVARPFFHIWISGEFGAASTPILYVLAMGFLFGLLAFVPMAAITAFGRQDIFMKLYWVELPLFTLAVILLVYFGGAIGAAFAWSFRIILDSILLRSLGRRVTDHSFSLSTHWRFLAASAVVLLPPVLYTVYADDRWISALFFGLFGILAYFVIAWRAFLLDDEKKFIVDRLYRTFRLKEI